VPPHRITELGISHIPEGGAVFPDMSVQENLELGAYVREARMAKKETLVQVYRLFPVLKERAGQLAKTLSGGERQMLAIGRGLMLRPRLCMLDEPSYGLAPKLVAEVFRTVAELREWGTAILLVEQNAKRALEIADRTYLLENGHIVLEGSRERLLQDDYLKKAYLGL